jgi:hypothetical protein
MRDMNNKNTYNISINTTERPCPRNLLDGTRMIVAIELRPIEININERKD